MSSKKHPPIHISDNMWYITQQKTICDIDYRRDGSLCVRVWKAIKK